MLYEKSGNIAYVRINRPDAMNKLNSRVIAEIGEAMDMIKADGAVRVVIITGVGEFFAAGADMEPFAAMSREDVLAYSKKGQEVFRKIEKLGIPTIAAINGNAVGGGFGLALACDIRIAADDCNMRLGEVGLGITPGQTELRRLVSIVGPSAAIWAVSTGATMLGTDAQRRGFVNEAVPRADVMRVAEEMAKTIGSKGPLAVQACCRCIHAAAELKEEELDSMQAEAMANCFATNDGKEGIEAFLEHREPMFIGK